MANDAQDADAPTHPEDTSHPDFALISAWEGYKATWRADEGLPDDDTCRAEALYQVRTKFRELIEELHAHTAEGVAIKLRYLFLARNETRWAELAILDGGPVDEEEMDLTNGMLWALIADVEKMQG